MDNLEEAIRERAYQLWVADGRPEGNPDNYWLNAQREMLTHSAGFAITELRRSHGEARQEGKSRTAEKKQAQRGLSSHPRCRPPYGPSNNAKANPGERSDTRGISLNGGTRMSLRSSGLPADLPHGSRSRSP